MTAHPSTAEGDIRLLLGTSSLMRDLARQVGSIATSHQTSLLIGETGVGKSRVARAMHALSPRSSRPFAEYDCGGTDGDMERDFVAATGGTVYFDEIADLTAEKQQQLAGMLAAKRANAVRVIAASGKDLATEVTELHFSESLYYLLGTMPIHLPPLRARAPEDLRETTLALIRELRRGLPGSPREMSERAHGVLARYHWPGNIRELRNVLERALLRAQEARIIDVVHLPPEVLEASGAVAHVSRTLADVERSHIEKTLRAHGANRTRAARELGISRATLIKKIREYDVADRHSGGRAGTQESA